MGMKYFINMQRKRRCTDVWKTHRNMPAWEWYASIGAGAGGEIA